MPRQSNGNYIQPANTAAVSGQAISSTANNSLITDIATEITNSVDRGGRSAMQAALPMGANKITGMADPTVTTDAATKNYVDTTTAAFFSTGDVKLTLKTTPDSGWLMFDDGTFGSAASGSSNSNSASNQALFTLIFNNIGDSFAPILTSGGGATTRAAQTNASSAWAANCRLTLPRTLGRALGVAGAGAGLTTRTFGGYGGAETATLGTSNLPPYTPGGTIANGAIGLNILGSPLVIDTSVGGGGNFAAGSFSAPSLASRIASISQGTSTFTGSAQGGTSAPFSILSPTSYFNAMVKL